MRILIEIADRQQAETFVEDVRTFPDVPVLTPVMENEVALEVVAQADAVEYALEVLRLYAPDRLAQVCECGDDEDSGGNRFRDVTGCPMHDPARPA